MGSAMISFQQIGMVQVGPLSIIDEVVELASLLEDPV